jgi:ubiquinone/menaquinone biosynthesis C-methylase UbiE
MQEKWRESWTETTGADAYGDLFYKRATSELGEMESSKAAASRMQELVKPNDTVLDVGCGAGHYLVSLRKAISGPFSYTGIDATPYYVELGRKAFADDTSVNFQQGDIFNLPLDDKTMDVAMCCNVLLHLPSITKPLSELIRVSRRHVLVRALIGETSFVIKHVDPREDGDEFDGDEPRGFHFLNIYSQAYIRRILSGQERVKNVRIALDADFDADRISDTSKSLSQAWDVTRVVNGMQISGYIVQPWSWLLIDLAD